MSRMVASAKPRSRNSSSAASRIFSRVPLVAVALFRIWRQPQPHDNDPRYSDSFANNVRAVGNSIGLARR